MEKKVVSGWLVLPLCILAWLATPAAFALGGWQMELNQHGPGAAFLTGGFFLLVGALLLSLGFFTVQPNEARALVLFGEYKGTVRTEGFHWANPLSVTRGSWTPVKAPDSHKVKGYVSRNRCRVSLRMRNFETGMLKVNDQRGNPIEIAAVVVWRVVETAQALFVVDDYESYVTIQSESALRQLANRYPYDHSDHPEKEVTLRDETEVVGAALKEELQERLQRAGVMVEEARLTHLAYAPEIATAMLRRQQAEAIIAARQKIVHGAVSMVEMALRELSEKQVVALDEVRKAAMVGNLLVVLCGESQAQPIVNIGTLYP
jgi:regulator of protease activity HflC (stomatin/prohibitin superfamily)